MSAARRAGRFLPVLVVAFAATVALAACASGAGGASSEPVADYRGEPEGVDAPPSSAGGAPYAAWLKNGEQLAVVLFGSSTCPPIVTKLDVGNDNAVDVQQKTYDGPCTMDYVPHTTVFTTPSQLDTAKLVTFTVVDVRFTLEPLTK